MKTIRLITLTGIVATGLLCCQEKMLPSDSEVYLHLQGDFNNTHVDISVDGNPVYANDSVTTNNLLSLADIDSTLLPNGTHTLLIHVNSNVTHSENFNLQQTKWIGIRLHPNDSSVSIEYSNVQFMYE